MKVMGNQFVANALKNLTVPMKSENDNKKEQANTESQRHIEQLKQMVADEAKYQKNMEANRIAKKIARGESVTNEEREQLRGVDEEQLRKAEQANIQRKQLSARLANATTKEQKNAILLEGKLSAGEIIEKGDEQYGELLMEAVKQAEAEHYGVEQVQPDTSIGSKSSSDLTKQAQLFDIRL
jgi:hypothetical protein